MATQPILQGYTLPYPQADGYEYTYGIIAASAEMADASLVHDLITTTGKREFALRWRLITSFQFSTIQQAYNDLLLAPTSANFTSPTAHNYTVTVLPGNPPLRAKYYELPAGERWDVEMRLREVA